MSMIRCAVALLCACTLSPPSTAQLPEPPPTPQVPTTGGLLLLDDSGAPVGACPLKHTDVRAEIIGFVARTTVRQIFENDTGRKIEAVYTFPLPQNAAVDAMVLEVGPRRIVGEIRERAEARAIYEAAVKAGHVAALLDQERPNIFTQAVANIEPGATITIEVRFAEMLKFDEGFFEWVFPMVVGPRYIPGGGSALAPGQRGTDTPQVPDGSKITPPVTPKGTRAGHDIAVQVTIDAGQPIYDLSSTQHEIDVVDAKHSAGAADDTPHRVTIRLRNEAEIPNRDFILRYRLATDEIGDAFLVHEDEHGRFFTLVLQPPQRVAPAQRVPRELIFVLDTSGSMHGYPIEKSKELMRRMLATMGPRDTFNIITFAGHTAVLWDQPRPATRENVAAATTFVNTLRGGGGTEMMKAIEAALVQTTLQSAAPLTSTALVALPADDRVVTVLVNIDDIMNWPPPNFRSTWAGLAVRLPGDERRIFEITGVPAGADGQGRKHFLASGTWSVAPQRNRFDVQRFEWVDDGYGTTPIRIVSFLTDGYVGNDMEIIAAIRRNAATTRVFSFGVGSSVNRFLLDGMAAAGRGEVEYVTLEAGADEAVQRFHDRVLAPVLTNIRIDWGTLPVEEVYPAEIPDLFAERPVLVHGRLRGPAQGTIVLAGQRADGPYAEPIPVAWPVAPPDRSVLPALWARAKVEHLMMMDYLAAQVQNMPDDRRAQIVELGVRYGILTQFTSFVAVETLTVTTDGEPVRIDVPVEMPQGVSREGVFGTERFARARPHLSMPAAPTAGRPATAGGGDGMMPSGQPVATLEPARARGGTSAAYGEDAVSAPGDNEATPRSKDKDEIAALRAARVQGRLALALHGLAAKVAAANPDGDYTADGIVVQKWRLGVIVTFRTLNAEVRAALVDLGFEIQYEATAATLLVGQVDVRKLDDLAALDAVLAVRPLSAGVKPEAPAVQP